MNPIQALRRIEKASAQNARVTTRLREAAGELGEYVVRLVRNADAEDDTLPRGYWVSYEQSCGIAGWCLQTSNDAHTDGYGTYPVVEILDAYKTSWADPSREALIKFADDVADGWLDELAAWLEGRAKTTGDAACAVENAVPAD